MLEVASAVFGDAVYFRHIDFVLAEELGEVEVSIVFCNVAVVGADGRLLAIAEAVVAAVGAGDGKAFYNLCLYPKLLTE